VVLLFVAMLVFWIWSLFDCISTNAAMCRNLPKLVWVILIVLFGALGTLAWLLLGRPQRSGSRWNPTATTKARRPTGPEDHSGYRARPEISDRRSAELDEQLEAWEREQRKQRGSERGERDLGET